MTGVTGTVQSYNWPNIQLKNKEYTSCIRREEGYCGLQISQAVPYTSPDSFSLNDLSTLTSDIGAANGGLGDTAAAQGTVTITGTVGVSGASSTHHGVFGGQVLTNTYVALDNQQDIPGAIFITGQKQYVIRHTQKNVAQSTSEVGFKLQWVQMPCNAAAVMYQSTGL